MALLSFCLLFANFSLALLVKLLLVKKACKHKYSSRTAVANKEVKSLFTLK